MTALGDHAAAELTAIGAPDTIKTPLITIVGTFADVPDPGTNWPIMRDYLAKLLAMAPLSELTNNPAEWTPWNPGSDAGIWQSTRRPDAWTKDSSFGNYFLLSEIQANQAVILHATIPYTP